VLHSERFVDKAPATAPTLLDDDDDDEYLCHPRTMYRILASEGEVRERRDRVHHPKYARPELLATAPNPIWTWDVTWLRGPVRYSYYPPAAAR
jgi:putative transposase